MNHAKPRKTQNNNTPSRTAARLRQQRDTVDRLIGGLDMLTAFAESADMGTAARIFYSAKEELVHWAVTMNFHESPQDRFINRRLYDNRLPAIEALIVRAMKNSGVRVEMLDLLGMQPPRPQPVATRAAAARK